MLLVRGRANFKTVARWFWRVAHTAMQSGDEMDTSPGEVTSPPQATTDQLAPFVRMLTHKMTSLRRCIQLKEAHIKANAELINTVKEKGFEAVGPKTLQNLGLDPEMDLNSSEADDALSKLSSDYITTSLNYSALEKAIQSARKAKVLLSSLGLERGAAVSLDAEEKDYVSELLNNVRDLSTEVVQLEDQKITLDMKILETQAEIQKKLQDISEANCTVLVEEAKMAAEENMSDDSPAKSKQVKLVEAKKKILFNEERKALQMKYMIQRLLTVSLASIGESENIDPLSEMEARRMLIKCGQSLSEIKLDV